MNKDWILFHLKEALGVIQETIDKIENAPQYGKGDYLLAMTQLYHHINTAWNAQNFSAHETEESSEHNFETWRQFPVDLDL